jgi:hypothetical protein
VGERVERAGLAGLQFKTVVGLAVVVGSKEAGRQKRQQSQQGHQMERPASK